MILLVETAYVYLFVQANDTNYLRELFEIPSVEYPQITEVKKNLILLKHCWDMVQIVTLQLAEWKSTIWQVRNPSLLINHIIYKI